MDLTTIELSELLGILLFIFSLTAVFTAFKYAVLNDSSGNGAVTFKVPVPEACSPQWNGTVLDEPSIKVPYMLETLQIHSELTIATVGWLKRCKMLLPRQWTTAWTCKPGLT